ncbi:MAG: glycosyltransferase family 2 protein [Alicyclobacillus sp.]|nr:glycosyltransferase family 2 protein [Alicyclobacillus sp.]
MHTIPQNSCQAPTDAQWPHQSDATQIGSVPSIRYSIVVPVFNEAAVLPITYARLKDVMDRQGDPYEIIFVDDGSEDESASLLDELAESDEAVRVIHFSRNFGHQVAITAGMDHAIGDAVIVMDADLQDPPDVVAEMIQAWQNGYDVVHARRKARLGETWFKRLTASLFYRLLQRLTDVEIPLDTGDFRLVDRKVCQVLSAIRERNRFVRGLVVWVGFRQTAVEYVRSPRYAGESKYPLRRMLKLSMDAITSFSDKPLKFPLLAGAVLTGLSVLFLCCTLVAFLDGHALRSGTAYVIAVIVFGNGLLLVAVGVVGQYVSRLVDDSRGRPLYVIAEMRGFHGDNRHACR